MFFRCFSEGFRLKPRSSTSNKCPAPGVLQSELPPSGNDQGPRKLPHFCSKPNQRRMHILSSYRRLAKIVCDRDSQANPHALSPAWDGGQISHFAQTIFHITSTLERMLQVLKKGTVFHPPLLWIAVCNS
ncbi:L-PSP endoribonuclease [Histoplasma ohiense]|nr:L-PSP endoribonuclease [Histoplasma ohiense (nom. inval.)]